MPLLKLQRTLMGQRLVEMPAGSAEGLASNAGFDAQRNAAKRLHILSITRVDFGNLAQLQAWRGHL